MGNVCCDPQINKGLFLEMADMRTGDILLARDPAFTKAGAFAAQGFLCWAINHVGIAIDPRDFPADGHLWQSHPEMKPDQRYMLHALTSGIKLWDVDGYLQRMVDRGPPSGHLYIRQLVSSSPTSPGKCNKEFAVVLDEYFGAIKDKDYEGNFKTMISGYFDSCDQCCPTCCENKGDDEDLFCSELVAEAYQRAGVLKEDRSADEFMPSDFLNSDGRNVEKTSFKPEYSLGPVFEVEGYDAYDDGDV